MVSQSTKKAVQLNGTLRLLVRVISAKHLKPILQVDAGGKSVSGESYNRHRTLSLPFATSVDCSTLSDAVRNVFKVGFYHAGALLPMNKSEGYPLLIEKGFLMTDSTIAVVGALTTISSTALRFVYLNFCPKVEL